jgi:hypothetical protein
MALFASPEAYFVPDDRWKRGSARGFRSPTKRQCIFTRGVMTVMSAQDRKIGTSDAECAAPLGSLVAYSGKYRVHGDEPIAVVDVS